MARLSTPSVAATRTPRAVWPRTVARACAAVACVLVAGAAFASLSSCGGGEGVEAPRVIAPDEDTDGCPSADSLLVATHAQLDAGALAPLRPHIERVLVQDKGLQTLLVLVEAVASDAPLGELKTLLGLLSTDSSSTLGAFKPLAIRLLQIAHGDDPALAGEHLDAIVVVDAMLTQCDAADGLQTAHDLLALEVRRGASGFELAPTGQGESSWLFAILDVLARGANVPQVQAALEGIEFDDSGSGGGIHLGRDAFIVLARLLAANMSAPDFDITTTRDTLEQVVQPRIADSADAQAVFKDLLDLFEVIATPGSPAFGGVQRFMGCVDRHDVDAAIPGLLYDLLTLDDLGFGQLLKDTRAAADKDEATQLRTSLLPILAATLHHPTEIDDAAIVVAALLQEDAARDVLGVALSLRGTGVLTELTGLVSTLLQCKAPAEGR